MKSPASIDVIQLEVKNLQQSSKIMLISSQRGSHKQSCEFAQSREVAYLNRRYLIAIQIPV